VPKACDVFTDRSGNNSCSQAGNPCGATQLILVPQVHIGTIEPDGTSAYARLTSSRGQRRLCPEPLGPITPASSPAASAKLRF
jgi:hypothetical protein